MTSAIAPDLIDASTPLDLPPVGKTASARHWVLRDANIRTAMTIAQDHELDIVIARALTARGVTTESAAGHLNPSLRSALPDPFVLLDMEKGVARLRDAIINQDGVGVFGDYDVDGTTAASILHLYFRELGIDVPVYLPDRIMEGYGPSVEAFKSLKKDGANVVVTVDCGASAHEVIAGAVAEGLDVVVVDHHLMSGPPPAEAKAVINPNRPDDQSGLGNLSAAGVAFMLVVALNRSLREAGYFANRDEPNLLSFLDLTALGLVCDVMEMKGLTRVLVSQGLKIMGGRGNPGLKSLGERAGVKGAPSTYHLGFLLGPRINAAGRIGHARLAFELMTTANSERRDQLAEKLHVMNAERQEIEANVQAAAIAEIDNNELYKNPVIVVAGDGWHPGVIGIVAGRLKEKYDRPVIVIGIEDGIGKGSGRSIEGVDLGSAISEARGKNILTAGGGHAMAAGLTIDGKMLPDFMAFLSHRLGKDVERALASRRYQIDGVIAATAVTKTFADRIESAGPFGPGNSEPVFVVSDMIVDYVKVVGKGHLSVVLKSSTGDTVRAIAFRAEGEAMGDILQAGGRVHVAGKVRADDWRGGDAAQLQITDVATTGP